MLYNSESVIRDNRGAGEMVDSAMLADELLHRLEEIFSPRIFYAICEKIRDDFFGYEMDVQTAIAERPNLFERAFVPVFGKMGVTILENVCSELHKEFRLDKDLAYSGGGDFAKFMGMKTINSNSPRLARV